MEILTFDPHVIVGVAAEQPSPVGDASELPADEATGLPTDGCDDSVLEACSLSRELDPTWPPEEVGLNADGWLSPLLWSDGDEATMSLDAADEAAESADEDLADGITEDGGTLPEDASDGALEASLPRED